MADSFQREERFIVIKRKHLDGNKETWLRSQLAHHDINTVECVVVESDWPEYEAVWKMIENRVSGAPAAEFSNPTRWFYAFHFEAEWWSDGGESREECIAAAAQELEEIWIVEARRQEPDFAIFDAKGLLEELADQECWGENGAEGLPVFPRGAPELTKLETELAEVLRRWTVKHGDLTGAQLDFVTGPERVDPAMPA